MRCVCWYVLAFIGLALPAAGQDKKGDSVKLQGKWAVVAMERNGKDAPGFC